MLSQIGATNAKVSQRYASKFHGKATMCLEEAAFAVGAGVREYWLERAVKYQQLGAIYSAHVLKILAA